MLACSLADPFPHLPPASRATLVDHFEINRTNFCRLVTAAILKAPTSQDEVMIGTVHPLASAGYSTLSFKAAPEETIREDKN